MKSITPDQPRTRLLTRAKLSRELRRAQESAKHGELSLALGSVAQDLQARLSRDPASAQSIAQEWDAERAKTTHQVLWLGNLKIARFKRRGVSRTVIR